LPYYEIIYEPGTISVAQYESDEEALSALKAHNERAKTGMPATPQSTARTDLAPGDVATVGTWPAERIKRVLVYDQHPGDYAIGDLVDAEALKASVTEAIDASGMQGSVHAPTVALAVVDAANPLKDRESVHDSQYKMQEGRELDLSSLES